MRFGLFIGGPLAGIGMAARVAEEHGYDSVWVAELTSAAFVQAVMAAQATSRVRVGT